MAKNHQKRSKGKYVKVSKLDLDLLIAQNKRLEIQNSNLQKVVLKSRMSGLNTLCHSLNLDETQKIKNTYQEVENANIQS